MSRVTVEITDKIAYVTLNRADKMNAVDPQLIADLIAAGQGLIDADIRAVVLSGAGKAFCAGLDVASFAALASSNPAESVMARSHGPANDFQEVAMVWTRIPVPVIAALHGVAFGAGLQIALGADIRIAAPDTKLAVMEMKWGLIPDMGGMVLLPRLCRSDVIRLLTYTATPIEAAQAERWGLVTQLADDPLAAARALAIQIAGKSPSAIRAAKRLIDIAETQDPAAVLMAESREQVDLLGKPDQLEVVAANMQGRAPRFDTGD